MNCDLARDWLLEQERPGRLEGAPVDVHVHIESCKDCQRLSLRLEELERCYRDEPLPATIDQARDACLARLCQHPATSEKGRRWTPPRWGMAAAVLLTVGAAGWLLTPLPQAQGNSDVVERLIDWNLQLTQSRTPDERHHIYSKHAIELKAALHKADLPRTDRELGATLLESGSWLSDHADPMAEADRFNDLAEQLLSQLDRATNKKDVKHIRRLADFYCRIAERGILANVERVEKAGKLSSRKQRKLARVRLRDAKRAEQLKSLLERAPNASRKEIRHALALCRKLLQEEKPAKK